MRACVCHFFVIPLCLELQNEVSKNKINPYFYLTKNQVL